MDKGGKWMSVLLGVKMGLINPRLKGPPFAPSSPFPQKGKRGERSLKVFSGCL